MLHRQETSGSYLRAEERGFTGLMGQLCVLDYGSGYVKKCVCDKYEKMCV